MALQGDNSDVIEFTGPWTGLTKRLEIGFYEEDDDVFFVEIADAETEVDQFQAEIYEKEGDVRVLKDAGDEAKTVRGLVKQHLIGKRFRNDEALWRHVISFLRHNVPGIQID